MNKSLTDDQIKLARSGYDTEPSRSHSINKVCYTNPEFFDIEQQEIFFKSWQFVCHEEKLRQPGNYVVTDIQGQSIFVIRTDEGQLMAFYNVCQHRAHELLKGEGNVQAITCPYHAWVYRLDGSLLHARRSELIENFESSHICLSKIELETFCHFVFLEFT